MINLLEHMEVCRECSFREEAGDAGGGFYGLPPNQLFMIFKIASLMSAYMQLWLLDLNLLSSSDETFLLEYDNSSNFSAWF